MRWTAAPDDAGGHRVRQAAQEVRMSRELVDTAAKLLAKAQSTTSEHEAIALVERSYSLLAQAINAYDQAQDAAGGVRRRERRRLYERRRRPRADSGESGGAAASSDGSGGRTGDPVARYRRAAADGGSSWRRRIDITL
jgi:hypothetical protein